MKKRVLAVALTALLSLAGAGAAFAAPSAGDDQCKGQKKNPHCPGQKHFVPPGQQN